MHVGHLYLLLNIIVVTYSQIVLKWQLNVCGEMPSALPEKAKYLFFFLLNPWVISAILAVGLGSITWILVLTKFELSYIYPFTLLSYLAVILLSFFIFQENLTILRLVGILVVMAGMLVIAKS